VLRSRLVNLLIAAAVGGAFLVGLLTTGALSVLVLLAVAAALVTLSAAAWPAIHPRGRRVRVLVVVLVLAIAAVKLVHG
jgi:hypothetical protein